MTLDEIIALYANGIAPVVDGDGWLASCPLCAKLELRFAQKPKTISVLCRVGCRTIDILQVKGLSHADLKISNNGNKPPGAPPVSAAQNPPPQKPTIDISIDDLPRMNTESWQAIEQQNDPPILFTHGIGVVRTRYDYHDDALILDPANVDVMRHELSQMANWTRTKTNKKTGKVTVSTTKPPAFLVKDVLASRSIPLPRLNRVVTVPVFAPDGTLLTQPGYNKASGVIYAPPRGYVSLPVPSKITSTHLDDAKKLIEELTQDFPFACDNAGDSPDRDNAIALLLLPFVRDMIDGPTPLHLIEASMPGSGKGLLAASLLFPGLGKITGAPFPKEDNELRKTLTAALITCKPVIWFDNINHPMTSGEFAGALTMDTWDDRILGASALANARVRALWLATGNNVTMSAEIARRAVRIRLAPQTDKPEERAGFLHDDQIEWITESRSRLVWAAHVICKNAIQQNLPKAKSKVIGSFERWSRLLGTILECAGYSRFLGNYRTLLDGSSNERQSLSLFAMTWYEWAQNNQRDIVTSSELLPIAENIDGINLRGTSDKARQTSLGRWLKSKHEVITEYVDDDPYNSIGIYRLRILSLGIGKGKFRGSQTWQVELLETLEK